MKHYTYGGSTAKRTLACPAWVNIAAKGPKLDRSNAAADRGTLMHSIMEAVFVEEVTIDATLSMMRDHGLTQFDIEHLRAAEKATRDLFDRYKITDFAVEPTFEVSEHVGGSTDMIASSDDVCIVIDYKFGRGEVDVKQNAQLAFYHWCAAQSNQLSDMVRGKRFVGAIIQPAIKYDPQTYEYSDDEIAEFNVNIRSAIDASMKGAATPNPGDHCEWCPAVPYCSAKLNEAAAVIVGAFDPMQDLAKALSMVEPLKIFIAAVESEALNAMSQQREIPGWKLVAKRKLRKWASESAALQALRNIGLNDDDLLMPGELKTPAQLEKVLKKNEIEFDVASLLDTSDPGVSIAPEDDPRAKVTVTKVN